MTYFIHFKIFHLCVCYESIHTGNWFTVVNGLVILNFALYKLNVDKSKIFYDNNMKYTESDL